eukprot:scaffold27220_cov116-Amphora_coffeaeformis.AAC.1
MKMPHVVLLLVYSTAAVLWQGPRGVDGFVATRIRTRTRTASPCLVTSVQPRRMGSQSNNVPLHLFEGDWTATTANNNDKTVGTSQPPSEAADADDD